MKTARQIALEVLVKIQRDKAYSNITLDKALESSLLSKEDKAFVTALVYGVLERKITLDYQLNNCLEKGLESLRLEVINILRLGAYQILYMDKVPVSAAVNESVSLAKKNRAEYASGLVNAVLRKIADGGLLIPEKSDDNIIEYYSIKYSCEPKLVKIWIDSYGEENAVGIMKSTVGNSPVTVRVNTLKTDKDSLKEILLNEGVEASESSIIDNALTLEKSGGIEYLDSFIDGLFHVQDISSQVCCKALDAKPGDSIIDMCAAPGGKSFTIAQYMENKGSIKAFDVYSARLDLVNESAERLGIDIIETDVCDASVYNKMIPMASKVLCDVPCSGLGVIGKKPEIGYKRLQNIDNLANLQYRILCTGSRYVKRNGTLVYSTCTLNKKENDDVCNKFLAEHPNFKVKKVFDDMETGTPDSDYVTLMPHINHCDGFFIAVFTRSE